MKIGIIGMGWVGASVAISTLQAGAAQELWLNDLRGELAEGEAMDLRHGASFYPAARIGTASVAEMREADAVVIAAGRGGTADESRLELLRDTAAIARDIGRELAGAKGLIVVVSNPVDILTQIVVEASDLPPSRVIGTGTMLDTARLRQVVARELNLDPRSIHGHVVGEHGDSEVVLWSSAQAGGIPLRRWPGWQAEREQAITEEVRHAAYEIIRRKGATNHAIGLVTAALLRWALRGERRIVTVSSLQRGVAGLRDVALSLPTVVGRNGAELILEPVCSPEERDALARSATLLRETRAGL
jgi:L-lactate dehydrogenase